MNTVATVNQTKCITNLKGKIVPLVYLNKTRDLELLGVNSLVFEDLKPLSQGIGVSAELAIKFDKDKQPETIDVIKKSATPYVAPRYCSTCCSELVKKDGLRCVNNICPATSRGFVFKLLYKALGISAPVNEIELMLNKYAIGSSDSGVVDTIEEFKIVFNLINAKNTQARVNHWEKLHGQNIGIKLWRHEMNIERYLKRTRMPINEFWDICNFKSISPNELKELNMIDPSSFVNGNCKQIKNLTPRPRQLIEHNMDFIQWMVKFFDAYEEKKWIGLETYSEVSNQE